MKPTVTKATIKRASKQARDNANQLDQVALDQLEALYLQANQELAARIGSYADGAGSIRLQSLRHIKAEVDYVLSELSRLQKTALFERMEQTAEMGIHPVYEILGAERAAGLVDGAVKSVRDFVAADGLQLSDRLWRIEDHAGQVVTQAISSAVIQGNSASEAAQEFINRGERIPAEVNRKIARADARSIINAVGHEFMTGTGSPYDNARRVFRTEINRAHGTAYQAGVLEHDEVVGTRFLLSSGHPEMDICDLHAKANLHGLGKGVYPRDRNPWPAHPNTLSYVEAVFEDEVTAEDKASKTDPISWLKQQPEEAQTAILNSRSKQVALDKGVLTRGEIETPWKVLKKKYQRKGVNLDSLKPTVSGNTERDKRPSRQSGELKLGGASLVFNDAANKAFQFAPESVKKAINNTKNIKQFQQVPGGSYCNYNGIALSKRYFKPGMDAKRNDVLCHEYGHWLDFHGVNNDNERIDHFLSSTPNDRGGIGDSMKRAMKGLEARSVKGRERRKLLNETIDASGDLYLADLFGALTLNKVGYGHTNSYYKRRGARGTEAMANLLCLYSRKDQKGWQFAKQELPELCADFEQLIKGLN